MNVIRHLRKIGNSQGIIIPKEMIEYLGWDVGDNIWLRAEEKTLTIEQTTQKPKDESPVSRFFRKRDQ